MDKENKYSMSAYFDTYTITDLREIVKCMDAIVTAINSDKYRYNAGETSDDLQDAMSVLNDIATVTDDLTT